VKNARNIQLEQLTTASPAALFVRANGANTENIRVQRSEVVKAKKDMELGPDVKQGAVVIQ
jgi:hypothetical protein